MVVMTASSDKALVRVLAERDYREDSQVPAYTPPQVKCRCALIRPGYAQYPAHRGRAFVWLG